jgi:hypothetical protein
MNAPGRAWSTLLLVALAGCTGGGPGPDGFVPEGTWGGDHVQLTVSQGGAAIQFDCAFGSLPAPISLDHGEFNVIGLFVQEHGGPVRPGEQLPQFCVVYSGSVYGSLMTLRVRTADRSSQDLGTYSLGKGTIGTLLRCL